MKTGFAYCTISLAIHLVVAAALLSAPFDRVIRHRSIVLDFNVIAGNETGSGGDLPGDPEKKKSSELKRTKKDQVPAAERTTTQTVKLDDVNEMRPISGEAARDAKNGTAGTDERGQVNVAGVRQTTGAPAAGSDAAAGGRGGAGVKTLNYSGPGGLDERHFSFIRDRIMQNIVYPERARRMGWEGRVTLSFTVYENGSIVDIKIVNSSGFPLLDENAKEAVARTNFKRKVPVRLVVLLPVEYRLK